MQSSLISRGHAIGCWRTALRGAHLDYQRGPGFCHEVLLQLSAKAAQAASVLLDRNNGRMPYIKLISCSTSPTVRP